MLETAACVVFTRYRLAQNNIGNAASICQTCIMGGQLALASATEPLGHAWAVDGGGPVGGVPLELAGVCC